MIDLFTADGITGLFQVMAIDLVLAGDNAVVIGLAAAGLPAHQRGKAILVGILAATVLRISFASATAYLMHFVGLHFIGGLLLGWVCWNMWVELRAAAAKPHPDDTSDDEELVVEKTFLQAAGQIVIADVSMSLDNVLAVAAAAGKSESVLVAGLLLSIGLMGIAANFVARLLHRHRWIAYMGLGVIVYVTVNMLYSGFMELWPYIRAALA